MTGNILQNFFNSVKLQRPFIIGYYGGENFGDELLLEIIQNILIDKVPTKDVSFYYSNPSVFNKYHKDMGFNMVNANKKIALLYQLLKSKEIILGGGGFWGVDFNKNVFLMSLIFFIARYLMFKKIYLIGVGYYSSTTWLGHVGAGLAGCAANSIIARDKETYKNFKNNILVLEKNKVMQDRDIAFYIDDFIHKDLYLNETKKLYEIFNPTLSNTVMIFVRDFKHKIQQKKFMDLLGKWIQNKHNMHKLVIEAGFLTDITTEDKNRLINAICDIVGVLSANYIALKVNPVSLYLFFKQNNAVLKIFASQFHIILIAYLSGVSFEPIAYDNKVTELLKQIGYKESQIVKFY